MSEKIKPVPHRHADVIKAWADGAIIQRCGSDNVWRIVKDNPMVWFLDGEYRLKPEPEPCDLVKYDVRVGDLWLLEESSVFFKFLVTRVYGGSAFKVEGLVVGTGDTKEMRLDYFDATLVLRRGEVNKL